MIQSVDVYVRYWTQELFQSAGLYFIPFYLFKNRGPLLRRSDISHIRPS